MKRRGQGNKNDDVIKERGVIRTKESELEREGVEITDHGEVPS